jgi:hypothetical protein
MQCLHGRVSKLLFIDLYNLVWYVRSPNLTELNCQGCFSLCLCLMGAWSTISLDFVEGLPVLGSTNNILVVVDKFIKYGHFIPLKHPFTTSMVAKLFLDHIYKLHGLSTAIVSDRDKVFTRNLWRELFALADVKLCMSSTYHPQSDGQT